MILLDIFQELLTKKTTCNLPGRYTTPQKCKDVKMNRIEQEMYKAKTKPHPFLHVFTFECNCNIINHVYFHLCHLCAFFFACTPYIFSALFSCFYTQLHCDKHTTGDRHIHLAVVRNYALSGIVNFTMKL